MLTRSLVHTTDARAILTSNKHSGYDLIPKGCDAGAHNRRHVPLHGRGMLQLHSEDNQTYYDGDKAEVGQPEAVLGRWLVSECFGFPIHNGIAQRPGGLFADDGAGMRFSWLNQHKRFRELPDDDGNEIQSKLLRVKSECGNECLWDLDGD